jgi:hypothetical protein
LGDELMARAQLGGAPKQGKCWNRQALGRAWPNQARERLGGTLPRCQKGTLLWRMRLVKEFGKGGMARASEQAGYIDSVEAQCGGNTQKILPGARARDTTVEPVDDRHLGHPRQAAK